MKALPNCLILVGHHQWRIFIALELETVPRMNDCKSSAFTIAIALLIVDVLSNINTT